MDVKILELIIEQRTKHLRVSRKIIVANAKAMHDEIYATDPRT